MREYLMANPDPENVTEFRFSLHDIVSLSDLKWENSHEFWYHGELFDLVEKKTENNQLVVRCINDKKEGSLVKLQDKINKENQGDPSSKTKSALLLKLIQTSFISVDTPVIGDLSSKPHFSLHNNSYTFPAHQDVLTPPPQQV
jgi:hypothetical protein